VQESRCDFCGAAIVMRGYAIERVIAQGPHGRVYRARDPKGRRVALKELFFAAVPTAQEIDAFEREAATLRALAHPRIPRFLDSFSEGAGVHLRLYLVSELIEGEPLSARIARGPLPEAELRDVARQALEVLAHLHEHVPPIIHRDLKPENLIVRPDGSLALVDFGSARWLDKPRTHGSTLVGTFGYMPPEQLGGTVDATSDLYALGATLLHAATGTRPSELLRPDLSLAVPPAVPSALAPFIASLVALRPDERPGSAREALDSLRTGHTKSVRAPAVSKRIVFTAGLGVALITGAIALRAHPAPVGPVSVRAAPAAPLSPTTASGWFRQAKPYCNALEATGYLVSHPPPAGEDGTGLAAGCLALAGRIDRAQALIDAAPADQRTGAAENVFVLADDVADRGDDVDAAPMMKLVLRYAPEHYQALYHAGMSEFALGQRVEARAHLEHFLKLYHVDDGFHRNAVRAVEALRRE
jgi:hypothetical protein